MDSILTIQKTISGRLKAIRKKEGWSQAELAKRSGVSLGSVKRFENKHEISFSSLVKIAIVLGYADNFSDLFARPNYQSIQDVLDEK